MLRGGYRLYGGLSLLVIAQGIGLGLSLSTSSFARIVWVAATITCGLASLGLLFVAWRGSRHDARSHAMADWIDQLDLSADLPPEIDHGIAHSAPRLSSSVLTLVARLHDYRDKLLVRHQRVQRLLRNVTDVLYHADADGRLTWITDSVSDMLGYSTAELRGYPLERLLADPDTDLRVLTHSAQTVRYPTRVYRRDGSVAWLLISSRRIDDAQGQLQGSEGIFRDGTRLIETQRQLTQEKERAQVTLAAIGDGVITTDASGAIDYVNPRAQAMLARSASQVQGQAFEQACRLFDLDSQHFVTGLVQECLATGASREWANALALVGDRAPRPDGGNHRSVTVTVSPIRDDQGQIIGAVVVLHDVTRLERISRELTYQANHDSLTGLLNRRAFERQLKSTLESAQRGESRHTLCYLDLDQFKLINDSCGHHAGDAMLRQISSQIVTQLRPPDTLARLGGDEFGIIFEETDLDTARMAADRLRQWVDSFRFEWGNKTFRLGASMGLAVIDATPTSAAEVLRRADTACYLAKEQGRNQVRIYTQNSSEARLRDNEVDRMQRINEALDNQGFTLFVQPIRPLGPGREHSSIGSEILLRMKHGNGHISPQSIVLTAERYSMASRIDRWVIDNALTLIAQNDARCRGVAYYSVNISGQSITDEQFVGFVRECIERSGIDPRRLVFEITETAAVTNLQRAADLMRSLRALGCRFALDDFGSGVSSFGYLKHLPSDFVKIDGKLVNHIADDPVERSIVEALDRVSKAVGLQTVAEHVESTAQVEVLRQIGIDYVQGYHVGRPIPFAQFLKSHSEPS